MHHSLRRSAPKYLPSPTRHLSTSNINPNPKPNSEKPTSAYYDDLIAVAGLSGDLTAVLTLLGERITRGCFNTSNTFKFLTETPPQTRPALFESLLQTLADLPNDAPGTTKRNAFDALLSHLCKSGHTHLALITLKTMARQSSPLHIKANSFNYLLFAHCRAGNLTSAKKVLVLMKAAKIRPDSFTFDAMVVAACRGKRLDGAMAILRRMEEEGVRVLDSTYAHIINGLLKLDYCKEALGFVQAVAGRDVRVDRQNYGLLARRLMRKNRWEEAKMVIREMEEKELVLVGWFAAIHLKDRLFLEQDHKMVD